MRFLAWILMRVSTMTTILRLDPVIGVVVVAGAVVLWTVLPDGFGVVADLLLFAMWGWLMWRRHGRRVASVIRVGGVLRRLFRVRS